jgi:hypothetical protein
VIANVSVIVLPAASRAVTVTTFDPVCRAIPLVVQLAVPVAVPLPPRLLTHRTWVTPMLSEAVPPSVSEDLVVLYVVLEVGDVIVTRGAVASRLTVKASDAVLPAASRAVTVSTFVPVCRAIPLVAQLVVPVAVPLPPRLFTHLTCVTPTSSAAVPRSVSEDVRV